MADSRHRQFLELIRVIDLFCCYYTTETQQTLQRAFFCYQMTKILEVCKVKLISYWRSNII